MSGKEDAAPAVLRFQPDAAVMAGEQADGHVAQFFRDPQGQVMLVRIGSPLFPRHDAALPVTPCRAAR
ncbi:hypothetical protein [Deinococcus enclensis]|uniref:Uncharacterized protein n=1 Tax=Deinococcus enclensis TaxID=1049582 RepID=A0ABT9MJD7_9DEIO|nr:hypothetical protein [Deinococcus enclensis]MDP9766319.1 hypothetical protein [Deinococcus enclensis]